jgi:hypothetical protein
MSFGLYNLSGRVQQQTKSDNLGGPFQGHIATQTILNYRDSGNVMTRKILAKSWNGQAATGKMNNHSRIITPFRAITSNGDFLARINYQCGGAIENNQMHRAGISRRSLGAILSQCDGTGVPAGAGNGRFVPDASDYITYKKQRAMNQNYNELTGGGDQSNASYTVINHVRRF